MLRIYQEYEYIESNIGNDSNFIRLNFLTKIGPDKNLILYKVYIV